MAQSIILDKKMLEGLDKKINNFNLQDKMSDQFVPLFTGPELRGACNSFV